MKITITLRGTLKKYMPGETKREIEVKPDCTCDEALQVIGLNYKEVPNFGFVVINGKRCMIYDKLSEGDELKAWSAVSGG
ncbi:MAG: MoaD/ThiS family protein [Anaerovoracaceae bacterium]